MNNERRKKYKAQNQVKGDQSVFANGMDVKMKIQENPLKSLEFKSSMLSPLECDHCLPVFSLLPSSPAETTNTSSLQRHTYLLP